MGNRRQPTRQATSSTPCKRSEQNRARTGLSFKTAEASQDRDTGVGRISDVTCLSDCPAVYSSSALESVFNPRSLFPWRISH